jgi:hypothetical protein
LRAFTHPKQKVCPQVKFLGSRSPVSSYASRQVLHSRCVRIAALRGEPGSATAPNVVDIGNAQKSQKSGKWRKMFKRGEFGVVATHKNKTPQKY